MLLVIGIVATVIGFILLKYATVMAILYKKHSVVAYRMSGVVCLITAILCGASVLGILKI